MSWVAVGLRILVVEGASLSQAEREQFAVEAALADELFVRVFVVLFEFAQGVVVGA